MKSFFLNGRTLASLILVLLTSCQTGNWGTPGPTSVGNLVPCSESTSTFSTIGAAESYPSVEWLPAGKYVRSNFEIYVDNLTVTTPANESQVQFLVQYSGTEDFETGTLSLRCRENQNDFVPYSTTVTIPVRWVHFNNGNLDVNYDRLGITFDSALDVQAEVSTGGTDTNIFPANLTNTLNGYWNSGIIWVRRSGDVFEFHGRRFEGSRRIFGKATVVRRDLPANSP